MIIDAHHHFWDYSASEYGWIDSSMEVLQRDFGPSELGPLTMRAGVDGVISVQARTTVAETDALLKTAKEQDLVKGVVGWVDLTSPDVEQDLERYASEPLVVGFRHVLQGEPDERYMLRKDFNRGVGLLHDAGFAYDILIFHHHLPYVPEFMDQHPGQTFILDHIAKPKIESSTPDPAWVRGIHEAARREQLVCKVSGMATEVVAGQDWSADLLYPYFETVLEAFGPNRLLFGSDWPVCLLRLSYADWIDTVRSWIAKLSLTEQAAILGGNANRVYQLEDA